MFLNNLLEASERRSNFLIKEKLASQSKQDKILAADVKSVLYYRTLIHAKTNNTFVK
ncbi:hypothetical protein [Nostoc sp. KVJ20]|uniref:hypothetical protein n=1 Tax=Nostoc sp. KVJ20 TaxID=457944 RepID=UPI00159EFFC0|nr:hypothetical protein [Nostoc sp. KVJ20]